MKSALSLFGLLVTCSNLLHVFCAKVDDASRFPLVCDSSQFVNSSKSIQNYVAHKTNSVESTKFNRIHALDSCVVEKTSALFEFTLWFKKNGGFASDDLEIKVNLTTGLRGIYAKRFIPRDVMDTNDSASCQSDIISIPRNIIINSSMAKATKVSLIFF